MDHQDERLLRALSDPLLWEDAPALRGWSAIEATIERIEAEDEAAKILCDDLLTGPSAWWPQRVRRTPGAYTLGVVRELLRRMPALVESRPPDGLQATSLAIAIAERLDPEAYWPDHVVLTRARAWREHASVLSFLGRYGDALAAVEKSSRLFEHAPAPRFDLARLAVVKASALGMQNRSEEAVQLARDAGETFLALGDRGRYVNARITEAAMLYDGGALEAALEVWSALTGDPGLDAIGAVRVAHNIALTLSDLGRQAEAVAPFARCVSDFERLGLATERSRSRWHLGNALLGTMRRREAIAALRLAWHELAELHLPVDAALAALDLAEALMANEQPDQVTTICKHVVEQLTTAGLPAQAMPALSLLREASAMGHVSRAVIRETHAAVKRVGLEARVQPRC